MKKFQPMLADEVDLKLLRYPVVASPKLDGVRATFQNGTLISRNLKKFGNKALNNFFQSDAPLDGELILGDPNRPNVFRETLSVVSSHEGDLTGLKFHVFDFVDTTLQFSQRLHRAWNTVESDLGKGMRIVPHVLINSEKELLKLEETTVKEGFEGVMLRDPKGLYKYGRSTVNEGGLLKFKRKEQSEARVLGFVEQMHNANEAKVNELGYIERSSHQANQIPAGILGAVEVEDIKTLVRFNIGTGFTFDDRVEIWTNRPRYLNQICIYEHSPATKTAPRHPSFISWKILDM